MGDPQSAVEHLREHHRGEVTALRFDDQANDVALFNVDYAAYSLADILLVLIAALAIGANEEIVTRGILLIGLRNSRLDEWKAWLLTVAVFALLHLVNVLGGDSPAILIVTFAGGTLLYVARRTFNNLLYQLDCTRCTTLPFFF